jgi:hypothetical protein
VRQLILEGDLQRGEATPRDQGLEIREMRVQRRDRGADVRVRLAPTRAAGRAEAAIFHRPEFKPMADCAAAWASRASLPAATASTA